MHRALSALRRHTVTSSVIIGAALGLAGGGAYAYSGSFQHTAGLWNHGIDGHHHYGTRTDGGSSRMYTHEVACTTSGCFDGPDVGYVGNHVHGDGSDSFTVHMNGAHFASPGPYLGHHDHR